MRRTPSSFDARLRLDVPNNRGPVRSPASAALSHGQQDADRLQLCGRSLDRQPRRRRCPATHRRGRDRDAPVLLARWLDDRFHRRIRRQSRCLCRRRRRRRAAAPDLSSGRRIRRGLDARRQEDSVQLLGQQLHALRGSALHRSRRGRTSHPTAAPHRRGRSFSPDGTHIAYVPAPQVAGSLEALPRRADHAHLDRGSQRLQRRENSPRQLQRSPSHVGRRHDLFPLRPQRPGQPVRLRHEDASRSRKLCTAMASTSRPHPPAPTPS